MLFAFIYAVDFSILFRLAGSDVLQVKVKLSMIGGPSIRYQLATAEFLRACGSKALNTKN